MSKPGFPKPHHRDVADVFTHFVPLMCTSEAVPIAADLHEDFQQMLVKAAGFYGLEVLGGYTRVRPSDGVLMVSWNISTQMLGEKITTYEIKAIGDELRRRYKAFSIHYNLSGNTPLLSYTFLIRPVEA
jgi:hypothetical protein